MYATRAGAVLAAVVVALTPLAAGATAPPDTSAVQGEDHAVADAAIAASVERLGELGFAAPANGADNDPDADAAGGLVSSCFGGVDAPRVLDPIPGESARVVSPVLVRQPEPEDAPEIGETIEAAVLIFEPGHEADQGWFVSMIGSTASAECRRDELIATVASDPAAEGVGLRVSVENYPQIEIGDYAAAVSTRVLYRRGADELPVTHLHMVAVYGRSVVLLRVSRYGVGPHSQIEPAIELALLARAAGAGSVADS